MDQSWDAVPSSRFHMRRGGQLIAAVIVLALLLAPAAANATPNRAQSGVGYQNTFEHVSERDAWTKHNGDPFGFVGFTNARPHSGTLHGRLSAYTGSQSFTLRRFISGLPASAECAARIWATFTGNGNARFAVHDTGGNQLANVNFQLSVDPVYREYTMPLFFPSNDDTFDFSITFQGPGGDGRGEVNIDDFAMQCVW
ncbi:MAG: hypothetical protein HOQ05_06220 [Corynebacteriales bacterium]|nr:hypothetical protein [Mycobacteriales bacterium]